MMAEDRTARPVSGEIMTDPAANAAADRFMRGSTADIVDADYKVVPRIVPAPEAVAPQPRAIVTPPIEGMDMLRKPDAPAERPPGSRGGALFWIAGVGAAGRLLGLRRPCAGAPSRLLSVGSSAFRIPASPRASIPPAPHPVLFVDGDAVNDGSTGATAGAGDPGHHQ